jgi:serine/threonine-protein kinase
MASVWLAHDERLRRDVAVKVIADALAGDEAWLRRFEREARAAASITHPGVVSVYDYGVVDGRPYLVMQYVDGVSLADAARKGRRVDPVRLARELLDAVAHVHAAGIVHRDIKPANVLLDRSGRAHLTDFGIARQTDATTLTRTGVVIGTLRYLAPEVLAGAPAGPASDLYAVGTVIDEAAAHADGAGAGALVEALTAERPEDRPASAEAALALLDATVTTEALPTAPTRIAQSGASIMAEAAVTARAVAGRLSERARGLRRAVAAWPRGVTEADRRGLRRLIAALAAIAVALALVVVFAGADGGHGPRQATVSARPSGASPDAPLDEQLDALDAAVRRAAR